MRQWNHVGSYSYSLQSLCWDGESLLLKGNSPLTNKFASTSGSVLLYALLPSKQTDEIHSIEPMSRTDHWGSRLYIRYHMLDSHCKEVYVKNRLSQHDLNAKPVVCRGSTGDHVTLYQRRTDSAHALLRLK